MKGGWRSTGFQLAVTACATLSAVSANAAPPAPGGLAPRAPQVMLYFSHNLGGGPSSAFGKPTFGLRVQQIRQAGNSGDPEAMNDPMSHREIMDWQLQGRSNLRVSLGHRLSYDLTNRTFGKPSDRRPIMALASSRAAPVGAAGRLGSAAGNAAMASAAMRPGAMGSAWMGGLATGNGSLRDSFNRPDPRMAAFPSNAFREQGMRDSGSLHEIAAAAVAALNPARFTVQARPAPRAGIAALRASTGQARVNN